MSNKLNFSNDEQFSSGGYLDGRVCDIIAAEIVSYDFQGKVDPPVCCAAVTFRPDGADEDGSEDSTRYMKIGPLDKVTPSDDGTSVVVADDDVRISKKSKAYLFAKAAAKAGFPIDEDWSTLVGQRVKMQSVDLPKFKNDRGETIESTLDVIAGPADDAEEASASKAKPKTKKATKAKAAKKAAPAKAASSGGDDDVTAKAEEVVMGEIVKGGGSAEKTNLPQVAFKTVTDNAALRNAVMKTVNSVDWLSDDARPWVYDEGVLSLGE